MNAPSQWETTLHCNVASHWLGASTKRSQVCWLKKQHFNLTPTFYYQETSHGSHHRVISAVNSLWPAGGHGGGRHLGLSNGLLSVRARYGVSAVRTWQKIYSVKRALQDICKQDFFLILLKDCLVRCCMVWHCASLCQTTVYVMTQKILFRIILFLTTRYTGIYPQMLLKTSITAHYIYVHNDSITNL